MPHGGTQRGRVLASHRHLRPAAPEQRRHNLGAPGVGDGPPFDPALHSPVRKGGYERRPERSSRQGREGGHLIRLAHKPRDLISVRLPVDSEEEFPRPASVAVEVEEVDVITERP